MTSDQAGVLAQVRAVADRVYPSEFGGSRALVSPNITISQVVRPDGDVHVGNLEQSGGYGPRQGWNRLRNSLIEDGFVVVDCRCGVYQDGDCFVATAPAS